MASAPGLRWVAHRPADIHRSVRNFRRPGYPASPCLLDSRSRWLQHSDASGHRRDIGGTTAQRVARGQAKRILREKNRRMIEFVDGRRLPVSRPYLEDARKLIGVDADLGIGRSS